MTTNLSAEAMLVADRIRKELNPASILLFGSVARADATEKSDLDLCLLFDQLPGRKLDIMRKARSISRTVYKGAIDIFAYSQEEWDAYIAAGASFELGIKAEAIPL